MATLFSLSWDSYKNNLCNGLSSLQQNGEFVDMTLAADGHLVKVHRMIMSLASPYIKDLLSSAPCNHPVIFLNKVSYTTLCSILEYIYTGEVLVPKDNLLELMEAAKALGIKGLEDLKLDLPSQGHQSQSITAQGNAGQPLSETGYYVKTSIDDDMTDNNKNSLSNNANSEDVQEITGIDTSKETSDMQQLDDTTDYLHDDDNFMEDDIIVEDHSIIEDKNVLSNTSEEKKPKGIGDTQIQYTLSNQGGLQLIVNRYIYFLRYTSKGAGGHRQWKCMDYTKKKCPAVILTRGDVIVKRFGAHSHAFHDKQIMKRLRKSAIFSLLTEAERQGLNKKLAREKQLSESKTISIM